MDNKGCFLKQFASCQAVNQVCLSWHHEPAFRPDYEHWPDATHLWSHRLGIRLCNDFEDYLYCTTPTEPKHIIVP